jgi:F-type H+-transporting ATPase subunit delta
MKITKQARTRARQWLRSCVVQGQLDEARVRQLVQQVTTAKPRDYLAILTYFQHLLRLELDRRTALVQSVYPLDDTMRDQLQNRLLKRHGAGLQFEYAITASLIGGLRIKVGSDVYDGSIQSRLNLLGSHF